MKVEFFPWRRLNSFFLLVSALLRLALWLVWALYRVRFVLSFCLLVCFSSDGQGWVRWYSCLLMIWFVFLFHLVFRWSVLHRRLLVVEWCWVLYSSGFLCMSSHYLTLKKELPRSAGRNWGQEEKGTTEDEMAGWYYWLNGHEPEWTLEVGDGQGGLACCNSWGRKESDTTERLNWTELNWGLVLW